jgi:tetratricopeptide (TPR) repeat protein
MQSEFGGRPIAEVLRDLCLQERSGTLAATLTAATYRVHVDCGLILAAESNQPEDDLGRRLVAAGNLSEGALIEALEAAGSAPSVLDLARALVQRDLVPRTTVARVADSILTGAVETLFRAERPALRFTATAPRGGGPLEADIVSTMAAILRGIAAMSGFRPIQEALLGVRDSRLRLRRPTPVPIERLPLSALQGFILSRVDGRTRFAELLSILPPEEEEPAARFVFGLLILGALEFDPPVGPSPFCIGDVLRSHEQRQDLEQTQEQMIRQVYARVVERGPHEILDVPPTAERAEVEQAYARWKAHLDRERLLPQIRERFREELTIIESRLLDALLAFTRPARGEAARGALPDVEGPTVVQDMHVRMELDKTTSKLRHEESNRIADSYYAKARKSVREGDFHNAIQYGKLAISHNASDARYFRLLGDCQARNQEARWQRMAEENYQRATQLDPWNPDYWICLGRLYKRRGLIIRARKQFEEALKLGPQQRREIQQELAALE